MSLGERLKEERERLGLSQERFAALGEATKRSQINWEQGVGTPNAAFLTAAAAGGVDVPYVLTGLRLSQEMLAALQRAAIATMQMSATNPEERAELERLHVEAMKAQAHLTGVAPPAVSLTAKEATLLDNYRLASADAKTALEKTSAALAKVPETNPKEGKASE